MAEWLKLTVAVLPPEDAEGIVDENKLINAIGEAFGPWTMLYGLRLEKLPPPRPRVPSTNAAKLGDTI